MASEAESSSCIASTTQESTRTCRLTSTIWEYSRIALNSKDPACHELIQSRYESHTRWATTCTIGSSKYKNLKLKKERRRRK